NFPPPPPQGGNPPPCQQQGNFQPPPNQDGTMRKRTVIPLPIKNGEKQGYAILSPEGIIIGYIAEKDFFKDENTTILEKDKAN
ncbi:MAG: hypothetical protein AABZ74_01045, partial [Cyanobacteriota bacterium]